MEDHVKFLVSFLSDLDLTVDGNDIVRYRDDANTPVLIDGRRLVLPTPHHCRNPNDENLIFHPLSENTVAEMSPTLKEIVRIGAQNLNILFTTHAIEIVQLASDQGRQVNLTSNQIDLIAKLKSCKPSSEKNIAKVVSDVLSTQARSNLTNSFIQIALTRGRVYRGEKRHRACEITFPFYQKLLADEGKPRKDCLVDVTGDERATLIEVHEALFPAVGEPEAYGYAEVTNRTIAPFFVTFALSYAQLASQFREHEKTLRGLIDTSVLGEAPQLTWVADLQNNDLVRKWSDSMPDQSAYRAPAMRDNSEYVARNDPPATVPSQQLPNVPVKSGPDYIGPKVVNSQGQLVELPPQHVAQATPQQNDPGTISPDEFLRSFSTPITGAFAAEQTTKSLIKAYVDGYGKFWDEYIAKFRTPPHGYPHPQQVPKNMLPPAYQNNPPLPQGFTPGGPMTAMVPTMPMMGMPPMMGGMPMPGMPGMPGAPMPMMGQPQMMMTPQGPMMMPGAPMMMGTAPPMMGMPGMMMGGAMNHNAVASHPLFSGSVGAGGGSISPGTI